MGMYGCACVQVMMKFLSRVGVTFAWRTSTTGSPPVLVVSPPNAGLHPPVSGEPAFVGNAGTAARFLAALCCTLPDQ